MNIIKCIRRDGVSDYEWVCEITKFMDRYITWKNKKYVNTYMWDLKDELDLQKDLKEKTILFRFPGTTAGCILLNKENVITDIIFNESIISKDKLYKKEVVEDVKKYIGYKLEVN